MVNVDAVEIETLRTGRFDAEGQAGQRVRALVGVDDGLVDVSRFVGVVELQV